MSAGESACRIRRGRFGNEAHCWVLRNLAVARFKSYEYDSKYGNDANDWNEFVVEFPGHVRDPRLARTVVWKSSTKQ